MRTDRDGAYYYDLDTGTRCDTFWMPLETAGGNVHRHVVSWADCADAARSVAQMLRWFRQQPSLTRAILDNAAICDVAGTLCDELDDFIRTLARED